MSYTRPSRGIRSSRGVRGIRSRGSTFRGRGRGSDEYYGSSRGSSSYSSSRGSRGSRGSFSPNSSSYRDKDDSYEFGDSNRYSSSHSRRENDDDDDYFDSDIKVSPSGSYVRSYSRHESEPERKRIRSEIGSKFKEAVSPRRSYDDLDDSNRSYGSPNSSPYRSSESGSFSKSHHHHPKEFSEFKKPLPPQDSSYRGSSSRGPRGRGIVRSVTGGRISRSTTPSYLKRSAVGRISKLRPPTTASRTQQMLQRKKLIRPQSVGRIRKPNDLGRIPSNNKIEEYERNFFDNEDLENFDVEEVLDQSIIQKEGSDKPEPKKPAVAKKPRSESSEGDSPTKAKKERPPMSSYHKNHITLKCMHCKIECPTFQTYLMHLNGHKHKASMEQVLFDLKDKLRHMRGEQRNHQRAIDEKEDNLAETLYCGVCKLNYKQTKQEHFTSDHHINLTEFLNPRCEVCNATFLTPFLYEEHKCSLNHIKRKAFVEKKNAKNVDNSEENNDEDNFMILDSVGSGDEDDPAAVTEAVTETAAAPVTDSNETPAEESTASETEAKPKKKKKKKNPKVVGLDFISQVTVYYCHLCRLCLAYNPNTNQEDLLLAHSRSRFHMNKYSAEKSKIANEKAAELAKNAGLNDSSISEETSQNGTAEDDISDSIELDASYWDDGGEEEEQKWSDDEEASNRYDRFGHSEEIEMASAALTSESEDNEAIEKLASLE